MRDMSTVVFRLPDLGEGLPDAEIVQWHVAEGDTVERDAPLLSMETAKAIVEVPSPESGQVLRLHGAPGDVIQVGAPLAEFATGGAGSPAGSPPQGHAGGTVVGEVRSGDTVVREAATSVARHGQGIKATPAVRALAKRMNVELAMVTPSGPDGLITAEDVRRVSRILAEVGPMEPLRGVRRAMARAMTQAHAEVVAVTVSDDADIDHLRADGDIMLRLIRALVAGCRAEPALNAWYDGHAMGRRLLQQIDLGVAMDTADGLFVPVLHNVAGRDGDDLRRGLEAMKAAVKSRTVPPEELRGNTITLSNFGTMGGRYSTPVVVPPTVAILGAGRARDAVVAVDGRAAVRRMLPLSLTFDHRCVTGGEATRFLAAVIADLQS
jgi:2-oxoisovalerate dehydrogenase E2 component (dihydrolipoyl transacylase)